MQGLDPSPVAREGEKPREEQLGIDFEMLDALAMGFAVLGRLHQDPPDEDPLESLPSLHRDWPLALDPSTVKGLDHLLACVEARESALTIRRDHSRLYGRAAAAKVSPYESVHRGRDGLVFDDETLVVRAAYRALSLHAPRLNREPDDHIGLELNFMAQTCDKALEALDADRPSEATQYIAVGSRFFEKHLSQWAPRMLESAAVAAETHFMKGVCCLTLGALAQFNRACVSDGPTVD